MAAISTAATPPPTTPADGDAILEAKSILFRSDLPCISDAVKSLLSVMIGEEVARPAPPTVTHMRDGKVLGIVESPRLDQAQLITCARVLIKVLNAYNLPTEKEWCEKYPQAEDEAAMVRLDNIAEFRVARVLSLHAKKNGGMHSKLFGASALFPATNACRHAPCPPLPPGGTCMM